MITRFTWTQKRTAAALALAQGQTREQVAGVVAVTRKTIYNWLRETDFTAEVDRLSLMIDISSRAERLRITMRAVRQKVKGETVETNRDLLDWLKYAQSETQGVNLGLTNLTEKVTVEAAQAAVRAVLSETGLAEDKARQIVAQRFGIPEQELVSDEPM